MGDGDPSAPRVTRLYGAVDLVDPNPATLVDAPTGTMTAPSPIVGSYLERYRIGDVLGQGVGEVLSARDEQIGRPVAIEFAHTRHVVHRDLKPANICRPPPRPSIPTRRSRRSSSTPRYAAAIMDVTAARAAADVQAAALTGFTRCSPAGSGGFTPRAGTVGFKKGQQP